MEVIQQRMSTVHHYVVRCAYVQFVVCIYVVRKLHIYDMSRYNWSIGCKHR